MNDPCFIFFLLPEDYEIEKDTLIQLWMAAENITDELHGEMWFGEFGLEYLLHCGTDNMTGMDRYRINTHKIKELRVSEKGNASCYLQWKKECMNNLMCVDSIHHVSLRCSAEIDAGTFETLEKFTQLRSLLFLGDHGHRAIQFPGHLFSVFSRLKALDLSRTIITELPSAICNMIELRYLDLSWTRVKFLPDIMCCYLGELQTLKLRGCWKLHRLPGRLNQLTKLRHLDFDVLGQLDYMPKGMGQLVHLRTLSAFLVSNEDGCKIQELNKLNNLSGKLCIAGLENIENVDEAEVADLYRKEHVEKLELRWTGSEICGMHHNSLAILEQLRPCRRLEELKIVCYEVKTIELQGQGGRVAFPKLEKLEINEMESLQVWKWKKGVEGDFGSLTHVTIWECPELEEFDVLPHLPSIKYFEIRHCPKLQSLYQIDEKLPDSLEELIVEDCSQIQKKCLEGEGEDCHMSPFPHPPSSLTMSSQPREKNSTNRKRRRVLDDSYDSEAEEGNQDAVFEEVVVAEAAAKIVPHDLKAFVTHVMMASYRSQEEILLMRLAKYFGRAFGAAQFPWVKIFKESTVAKMIEIPLHKHNVSDVVYEISADLINQLSLEAVSSFILSLLDSVYADLASQPSTKKGAEHPSSKSQVAVFFVLAMVLRRKPEALISVLPILMDNSEDEGQDKLLVIVWMVAQTFQGDLSVGLYAWARNLLPILNSEFGSNPQSRDLILQLIERILSAPDARNILMGNAVWRGERLVPPSSLEILIKLTYRVCSSYGVKVCEAVYGIVKEVALANVIGMKAAKQVSQEIFSIEIKAAGESIPEVSKEGIDIFIWSLAQHSDCYKLWEEVYLDNLVTSVAVLRNMSEQWKKIDLSQSSREALKETLKSFQQKNEEALLAGNDASQAQHAEFKNADKYCNLLVGRLSPMHDFF